MNSSLHIGLITREYPPETGIGGISTYSHNLAHALTKLGHDVHVISESKGKPRDYFDQKVCVHRTMNFQFRGLNDAEVFKKSILQLKLDIIEAPEYGAQGLLCACLSKTPVVTRLHTPTFLMYGLNYMPMTSTLKILNYMEKKTNNR